MMCRKVFLTSISLAILMLGCSVHADDGKEPGDKPYTLAPAAEPAPVGTGKPCQYRLSITPKAPWELKTSTPLKVQLAATAGLKLAKKTLTWQDAGESQGTAKMVQTGCEGQSAGSQKVDAELSFFLCTEEICQRHTDKVSLSVQVQ
jgi:hypothetical protein